MLIQQQPLTDFVSKLFQASGATEVIADEVAAHLVLANLKGHDSHGVGMIPSYVYNIAQKLLDPTTTGEVIVDKGAVILYDAKTGFGQVAGRLAMDLAIERAKSTGVVCLGVRNAHHLGRIGTYGEHAAAAGLGSTSYVNVVGHEPQVSPFGGRDRRMTTNPFCATLPRRDAPPVVLDMATSAIALGKVRVAHKKGEPVPDGVLVDHEGRPTNNASVMYEEPFGALGPFGGHKGYGLAVMCELLGGGLAGHWTAQPKHPRSSQIINNMLSFVFDPDLFGGGEQFDDEMTAMIDYLHSTTPAVGTDKVRIPGEPERESEQARRDNGIPIDSNSWQGIVTSAYKVGLTASDIPS